MDSTTVTENSTPDPERPAEDQAQDLCCRSACPACVLDEPIAHPNANTTCDSKEQRDNIIYNDDELTLLAMLEAFERAQELVDQLRANDGNTLDSNN